MTELSKNNIIPKKNISDFMAAGKENPDSPKPRFQGSASTINTRIDTLTFNLGNRGYGEKPFSADSRLQARSLATERATGLSGAELEGGINIEYEKNNESALVPKDLNTELLKSTEKLFKDANFTYKFQESAQFRKIKAQNEAQAVSANMTQPLNASDPPTLSEPIIITSAQLNNEGSAAYIAIQTSLGDRYNLDLEPESLEPGIIAGNPGDGFNTLYGTVFKGNRSAQESLPGGDTTVPGGGPKNSDGGAGISSQMDVLQGGNGKNSTVDGLGSNSADLAGKNNMDLRDLDPQAEPKEQNPTGQGNNSSPEKTGACNVMLTVDNSFDGAIMVVTSNTIEIQRIGMNSKGTQYAIAGNETKGPGTEGSEQSVNSDGSPNENGEKSLKKAAKEANNVNDKVEADASGETTGGKNKEGFDPETAPKGKEESWLKSNVTTFGTLKFLGTLFFAAWSFEQLYNAACEYQAQVNGCWQVGKIDGSASSQATQTGNTNKCKIGVLTCNPAFRVTDGNYTGLAGLAAEFGSGFGGVTSGPQATMCTNCYNCKTIPDTMTVEGDIGADTSANGGIKAGNTLGGTNDLGCWDNEQSTNNGGCGHGTFNGCPVLTKICGTFPSPTAPDGIEGTEEDPCTVFETYPYPSPGASPNPDVNDTTKVLCPNWLDTEGDAMKTNSKSKLGKNGCKKNDKKSCSKFCSTSYWSVPSGYSVSCVNMSLLQCMGELAGYSANSFIQVVKKILEIIIIVLIVCAAVAGIGYLIYWCVKNKKNGGGGGETVNVNVNGAGGTTSKK
jgi:hypothetical protein